MYDVLKPMRIRTPVPAIAIVINDITVTLYHSPKLTAFFFYTTRPIFSTCSSIIEQSTTLHHADNRSLCVTSVSLSCLSELSFVVLPSCANLLFLPTSKYLERLPLSLFARSNYFFRSILFLPVLQNESATSLAMVNVQPVACTRSVSVHVEYCHVDLGVWKQYNRCPRCLWHPRRSICE